MNLTDASPRKWTKGCSFTWAIVSQVWVISLLKGIWMCFADKHTKSTKPGVKGYHRKEKLKKNPQQNPHKKPLRYTSVPWTLFCGPQDALAGGFGDIVSQLPLRDKGTGAFCFYGIWIFLSYLLFLLLLVAAGALSPGNQELWIKYNFSCFSTLKQGGLSID